MGVDIILKLYILYDFYRLDKKLSNVFYEYLFQSFSSFSSLLLLDKNVTFSDIISVIFFLTPSSSICLDCSLPLTPIISPFLQYCSVFSAILSKARQSIKSVS